MKTSTFSRNVQLDRFSMLANNGFLRLYTAPMPDGPDQSTPKTAKLLSEHRLGSPAFQAAFNGTIKSNAIADDPEAIGNGEAEWFRVTQSDGATVLFDGSIGRKDDRAQNFDMRLNSLEIQARARVSIDNLTISQPS